jgi:hypothetical protein
VPIPELEPVPIPELEPLELPLPVPLLPPELPVPLLPAFPSELHAATFPHAAKRTPDARR